MSFNWWESYDVKWKMVHLKYITYKWVFSTRDILRASKWQAVTSQFWENLSWVGEMLKKKKTSPIQPHDSSCENAFLERRGGGGIIIRLHHQLLFKKGTHGRTLDLHFFLLKCICIQYTCTLPLGSKRKVWGPLPKTLLLTLFMTKIWEFVTLFMTWPEIWSPVYDCCGGTVALDGLIRIDIFCEEKVSF